jgi:hypothetical protein
VTPFLFPVAKDFALLFFDRYVSTEPTGSQSGRKSVSRWADQDLIGICQCGWGALVAAYEDSFVLSPYFIQGTRHQDLTHLVRSAQTRRYGGFPTPALVRAVRAASASSAGSFSTSKNDGDWPMKSPSAVGLVRRIIEKTENLRLRNVHGSGGNKCMQNRGPVKSVVFGNKTSFLPV